MFSVVSVYVTMGMLGCMMFLYFFDYFVQGAKRLKILKNRRSQDSSNNTHILSLHVWRRAGGLHSTEMPSCYRPQCSCGKVMFLHVSVILPTDPPPAQTPLSDGHCSGRYASYWNAFLLILNVCCMINQNVVSKFSTGQVNFGITRLDRQAMWNSKRLYWSFSCKIYRIYRICRRLF